MADTKGDSSSQQKSTSQQSVEEVDNEPKVNERTDAVGSGHGVEKSSDSSSRESPIASLPTPCNIFQASSNSNSRPHFSYGASANLFSSHSSFSSSELRLAPSKFTSSFTSGSSMNSSSSSSLPISKPVLRPPQLLGSSSSFSSTSMASSSSPFQSKTGYTLNPSKLGNPFAKVPASSESPGRASVEDEGSTSKEKDKEVNTKTSSESANIVAPKFVPLGKKDVVERTDLGCSSSPLTPAVSNPATSLTSSCPESASQVSFVPRPSHSAITSSPASSGFVFGQNLHERVEASPSEACAAGTSLQMNGVNSSSEGSESGTQAAASASFGAGGDDKFQGASTNGDSEMLFSSVLKREPNLDRLSSDGGEVSHSKSLSEAAREYEESRAVKRKYEEVAIITGEEEEDNVLQITCKLFAFNIEKSSWVERGRGQLRVNDKSDPEKHSKKLSRLVMRTQGSLRVVLNTKASPVDTERLLNVLVSRVELQKQLEESQKDSKEDEINEKAGPRTLEIPPPAKKPFDGNDNKLSTEKEMPSKNIDCSKVEDSEEKMSVVEEKQHPETEAST